VTESRDSATETTLLDLERRQRDEAPTPGAPIQREAARVRIPEGGSVPRSAALLERLYAGDLVSREKKPFVIDTRRCWGPYLASVDEVPMVVLDACSQIATLTHGFAHPKLLADLHEGRFDACLPANLDARLEASEVLAQYERELVARAPAGLEHACFVTAGGAEANEKAFRLARLHAPDQSPQRKRVLAFQQGFHGRTFVSLMSTWNPAKREAHELDGYRSIFADRDLGALERLLDERLDEIYAVIVEPMQAEGGDVHLTREFLLGVRRLTAERGLCLIADEVQTGFFTGGPFFWWKRLGLGRTPEESPDLLTCAKKASLGVVLSRWPDPEPSSVNIVSALRGLIHLESAGDQDRLEAMIKPRLDDLAGSLPHVIDGARAAGTTFAFDLADADARTRFIAQRFQRGFMTYQAGERTIRFRLNASFEPASLDDLFARIRSALTRLDDETATQWEPEGIRTRRERDYEIREVEPGDWPEIMELEAASYEPERVDSQATLQAATEAGVGFVARDADGALLGFCAGGPIEHFATVAGPDRDRYRAADPADGGVAFYSADVTVSATARGRGVGRALKQAQLEWAQLRGYRFATGRNRVGETTEMSALNRSLGAYEVARFEKQYGGDGVAAYYRIPLQAPSFTVQDDGATLDLGSGIQRPFGPSPEFVHTREWVGPTANRLNLSNWATIDVVHYAEHLRELLPRGMKHLYFTSSPDELIDKSLRCLRLSRPQAQIAIGLDGGYVGHVTAAARSLSDPAGFVEPFALFEWPRLPHPADDGGIEATEAALDAWVSEHGADRAFGLYVELVGQRSGKVIEDEAAQRLASACRRHDIPLVLIETSTGGYRNGEAPWRADTLPEDVVADLVLWYPGGQLGHVFAGDRYWIGKPLTLISTWDGDEVSIIRTHEALRAAWKLDLAPAVAALADLAEQVAAALGGRAGGSGLYRTIAADAGRTEAFAEAAAAAGVRLGRGAPGVLVLAPALDVEAEALASARDTLLEAAGA
jgi:4-aminobutyrate aminotransferase-like enzyme/GNAT superfamily N-acetyltransferase